MKPPLDPPITFDELLARCMGDLEFSHNILHGFVVSSREQLDEITNDIAAGVDRLSTAKKVHRLKGTAATVAARPLRATLEELETLLREAQCDSPGPTQIDELTERAQVQFRQVAEFASTCLQ
ncbi:MAG: Hpt domain-containing protein [Pirellulaceae bacterium]